MALTRYFGTVAEIHRAFSATEHSFKELMAREMHFLTNVESNTLDKDLVRNIIDDFETKIASLKVLRDDLHNLRTEIGSRGWSLFKHGKIKAKIDQIITRETVQELRTEMKKCVRCLRDAEHRQDYDTWAKYIREYDNKYQAPQKFPYWCS